MKVTALIRVFACTFLLIAASLGQHLRAQCPSVVSTGDPAVILVNIYGIPHLHYFADATEDIEYNTTAGIQIGAIFSPGFQLVSGAEMSWQNRSPNLGVLPPQPFTYKTFFLEIPLDIRSRMYDGKQSDAYFILGAGLVLRQFRETNEPGETEAEMLYHQFFVRTGFEHTTTIDRKFNILWGLLLKADPLAIADQEVSRINGSYYAGLKVGLQFGF